MLYQSIPTPLNPLARASRAARGFTLVEVLAVVAVILVAAALLFPLGKSMIEKSHQAQCTSNLRQLYMAVRQYAQENNDRIIYAQGYRTEKKSMDWAPELAFNGYLQADSVTAGSIGTIDQVGKIPVFRCPAALANRRKQSGAATQYTYGFNTNLSTAEAPDGTKTFARLSRPSLTLMISEGSGTTGWYLNSNKLPNSEHGGLANLLFCDGHVEMRDPRAFPARSTPDGKLFWNGVES